MIKVLPSLLAADPLDMGREIGRVLDAGADGLHVDVMDAHFVPNLSFSPALVRAVKARFPGAYQDVHLMMEEPGKYLDAFIGAGADAVTVHAEISGDVAAVLRTIREKGCRAGLSLKPGTPAEAAGPYLPLCDQLLVMTVEPGFGGQKFMDAMLPKITALRQMGFTGPIQVDGGINPRTAALCAAAGADTLIMGTAVFRAEAPQDILAQCRALEGSL